MTVIHCGYTATNRHPVHVNVEDVHENAEAHAGRVAQAKFRRRNGANHGKQFSIRGTDHQSPALRRLSFRIAEKKNAPDGQRQNHHPSPNRNREEHRIDSCRQSNVAPSLAVNGNSQTGSSPGNGGTTPTRNLLRNFRPPRKVEVGDVSAVQPWLPQHIARAAVVGMAGEHEEQIGQPIEIFQQLRIERFCRRKFGQRGVSAGWEVPGFVVGADRFSVASANGVWSGPPGADR